MIYLSKLGLSAGIQTTQLLLGPSQHCHQLFSLCTPSCRILGTLLLSHLPGTLDLSSLNFTTNTRGTQGGLMPVTTSSTLPEGELPQIINYEARRTQSQQLLFIYATM